MVFHNSNGLFSAFIPNIPAFQYSSIPSFLPCETFFYFTGAMEVA